MKLLPFFLSSVLLIGLALATTGCGGESTESSPEVPATRGQRDRVMSELHGSRKLLGDAIEAADATKFAAAGDGDAASAAVAVAGLIQMEQGLLDALQNSTLVGPAHPSENEDLSREERQKISEESAAAMRTLIGGCLDRNPPSAMRASAESAGVAPDEMLRSFRSTRDATIAYARESEHNFLRRKIEIATCGSVDLITAMMFHAELTTKVAEYVRERSQ